MKYGWITVGIIIGLAIANLVHSVLPRFIAMPVVIGIQLVTLIANIIYGKHLIRKIRNLRL